MKPKRKKRQVGRQILHWLQEKEPRDFDELTHLWCRLRYKTSPPRNQAHAYQSAEQAITYSVTRLALNGLVRVTADVPPFDGLKVLLTDKGRAASRRRNGSDKKRQNPW